MNSDAELCPACKHPVRPGATFCTQCGSPLNNRGARREGNINHAQRAALETANRQGTPDPGSISVVPGPVAPARHTQTGTTTTPESPPGPGGGGTMTTKLELVPASAGKRLGAAVLDWLGPIVVLATTFSLGIAGITQTRKNGFIVYDTGLLVLLGSIGLGVTVVYIFVILGLEAKSGNTVGNKLMGIRSTDADGYAPGAGAVFVRGIITGGVLLVGVLASVILSALGLINLVLWIGLPLMVLGAVWAILVVVSNAWDKEGKLRGWQDKAAKALVFDVNAGRNPVTSGGIQGPYSFAPMNLPPVLPVASPVPGGQANSPARVSAPVTPDATVRPAAATPPAAAQPSHDPNQWRPPAQPRIPAPANSTQPNSAQAAPAPADSAPANSAPANSAQSVPAAGAPFAPAPQAIPGVGPSAQNVQPNPGAYPGHSAGQGMPPLPGSAAHPDDDVERTQMRPGAARALAVLRIRVDDGQDVQLGGSVLLGRNPAPQPGETVEQLLPVSDPGRSISKTHLHLRVDGDGVWVTDRNSTNGSAVTTPDGIQTRLHAGEAVLVRPGSTVHFGDRSFHLGQA